MADERDVFTILEDIETRQGEVPHKINEGDSPIANDLTTKKNGVLSFAFKDINGNVVLPQLNPEGAIVVSLDSGTTFSKRGKVIGSEDIFADICEIPLSIDKLYTKISAYGSCFRNCVFELVYINDFGQAGVTEEIIGDFVTGSGQYNYTLKLEADLLSTIGGIGVQKLVLRGKGHHKVSDMRGKISLNEIA